MAYSMHSFNIKLPQRAIRQVLLSVLAASALSATVFAQAVKPQISELPSSAIRMGCGYYLDDWQGAILAWAPLGQPETADDNRVLIAIDGEVRSLPIRSRSDQFIAASDDAFAIEIPTAPWKQVGSELSEAKATLSIRNLSNGSQTRLISKASQGC